MKDFRSNTTYLFFRRYGHVNACFPAAFVDWYFLLKDCRMITKNARRRVLIRKMEALGERGVAVDSLKSLKQTHARETTKLAALTDAIAESMAGTHEKERHVTLASVHGTSKTSNGWKLGELEQYLAALVELKRKVLVRADDLANMESASMLSLGPNTWNHLPINTFDNAPMNMQVFADGIKIENNTIIGPRNGLDFGDGIKIENNTIIGPTNDCLISRLHSLLNNFFVLCFPTTHRHSLMTGETPPPPQPKQPIDKAYSIASIKAFHNHLEAPPTTESSTIDPLHETNDSLVVMWMYSTISPKLVEMVFDVDTSAHGVWKRLKDLFHNNKDARVTQLDNEIRNMSIGRSSVTDFFQDIKSKADRLANLDSPVKDTSLVTYAINGIRSKYPDAARVIRLREKAPTFNELRLMMILEESDMSHQSASPSLLHNTSSLPTVLVASTTPHDKANTMATSGFDVCRNLQRGSCSYKARCKFVHGANDH
ncbi:WRKY family transcription factor [Tanacetum coccineum]